MNSVDPKFNYFDSDLMMSQSIVGEPDRIVLICGSAGALKSFLTIAAQLPSVSSSAYVYLAHLSQTGPSYLKDLLDLKITLPVHEVDKAMKLQSGHLYIPTQGKDLVFHGNQILSVDHNSEYYFTPSFNRCIESAVESFDKNLVVSILSGRLDDGIKALQKVYEVGATTLVQDPDEAPFSSMPSSAIRRDHPDCVRSAQKIGEFIAKFASPETSFEEQTFYSQG